MELIGVIVIVGSVAVLAASVLIAVRGVMAERRRESALAESLAEMERAALGLSAAVRGLTTKEPLAGSQSSASGERHIIRSDERIAAPADRIAQALLWHWITPTVEESLTYAQRLGPLFGDTVLHAAKVGVIDREQAELLVQWSESTSAAYGRERLARPALVATKRFHSHRNREAGASIEFDDEWPFASHSPKSAMA